MGFGRSNTLDRSAGRNHDRLRRYAPLSLDKPTDGQTLVYDASRGLYVPQDLTATLAGMTDTDISSPTNGQLLQWNGTDWENVDVASLYLDLHKYTLKLINLGATSAWMLDETTGTSAADLIGSNTGTIEGSPTLNATGAIAGGGGAITFDGTNDDVQINDDASIEFTPNATNFTVSCWYKPTATGGGLVTKNQQFNMFNNASYFLACRIGNGTAVVGTTATNDGYWHHGLVRSNGTNFEVWLDGALEVTGTCGSTSFAAADWYIGALGDTTGTGVSGARFTGGICAVAIWNGTYVRDQTIKALARGSNVG